MDQGSNKNHSPAYNFTPTVTKFCVMWEGLSLPHDTKFGNCRCKIVDSRSFHSWSLIHGLRWSGLIKVGPVWPLPGEELGWNYQIPNRGLILGLHPANKRRRYFFNNVSHWLGTNLESVLKYIYFHFLTETRTCLLCFFQTLVAYGLVTEKQGHQQPWYWHISPRIFQS